MPTDFNLDHAQIGWDNTLRQHASAEIMEAFFKAFFKPFNTAQKDISDIVNLTTIDKSEGRQLDGIAEIVGVSRDIPEAVFLPFFGYIEQPAGRGYNIARYRRIGEAYATAYLLPDEELRALIKGKIVANNSRGTVEDIISFCKAIFQVDRVKVTRIQAGLITIEVSRLKGDDQAIFGYFERFAPIADGVAAIFSYKEFL